jgi:hypothetical protein
MKITLEIPDTSSCAFFNYVYCTSTGMSLANKPIDTDELRSGEVIICDPDHQTEKGGVE